MFLHCNMLIRFIHVTRYFIVLTVLILKALYKIVTDFPSAVYSVNFNRLYHVVRIIINKYKYFKGENIYAIWSMIGGLPPLYVYNNGSKKSHLQWFTYKVRSCSKANVKLCLKVIF